MLYLVLYTECTFIIIAVLYTYEVKVRSKIPQQIHLTERSVLSLSYTLVFSEIKIWLPIIMKQFLL